MSQTGRGGEGERRREKERERKREREGEKYERLQKIKSLIEDKDSNI